MLVTKRTSEQNSNLSIDSKDNSQKKQEIKMTTNPTVNEEKMNATPKGYGINWDTAEARVKENKDFLMAAPPDHGPRASGVHE